MTRGKYIVIEGPEAVGKSAQVKELAARLQIAGLAVRTFSEPDSQSDLTSRAIRQIIKDPRYPINTVTEVLLYNAARSQSLDVIRNSVEHGIYCIVERNYLTTLAVQYYGRGDVPDYDTINKIVNFAVNNFEPDLTIVLDAPVQTLLTRITDVSKNGRPGSLNAEYMERVRAGYLWEANQRKFPIVVATGTSEEVTENIWKLVVKEMSDRTSDKQAVSAQLNVTSKIEPPLINAEINDLSEQQLIIKTNSEYKITDSGKQFLSELVTSVDSNVYAFYDKLSPITVAAAMARLSRRGDDMRITILDEFANRGKERKDEELLKRVITAYGDDSVQQLAGIHLVVENASNLLTKKLEWGRLAAYLEQSTRYIYFDKKDKDGKYRYFTPSNLDVGMRRKYTKSMNQIFDIYSELVHKMTAHIEVTSKVNQKGRDAAFRSAVKAQACDTIRPILPVATTSTVGIYASAQALESLIMHLQADPLFESREVGQRILNESRKVMPTFLERADKPERGGAFVAYKSNTNKAMQTLADNTLNKTLSPSESEKVTLIDFWPKNELDLVADMLYEYSNLPLKTIKQTVSNWSFEQKVEVIRTYFGERLNRRHKPGRALEKVHYSWDLLCDYGIFRDLQRHRMVDDLTWQKLTPRYGYEVPKLVEDAGLSEQFEQAFEISLKLYSELQLAGYEDEAQYATLLGNLMRWKVTYNGREAFHLQELRTSPQGHPGYRKLSKEMHDKLAEVHPILAAGMIFINKSEDPELTRLAAERYTQFKLNKLNKIKS